MAQAPMDGKTEAADAVAPIQPEGSDPKPAVFGSSGDTSAPAAKPVPTKAPPNKSEPAAKPAPSIASAARSEEAVKPAASTGPGADEEESAPRKAAATGELSEPKPAGSRAEVAPSAAPSALPKAPRKAANTSTTAGEPAPEDKAATAPAKRLQKADRPGIDANQTQPSTNRSKETTMASNVSDYTAKMNDTVSELQDRSKATYEKSSEMMSEVSDSTKGNVEAMVESGKIFSSGMQELARTYVEDAKSAYEQMTADLKEMAAIKSPTELLQLQGKIMRRNFDAVVASTSKNTEKMMKLSNEAFAPISARLNVAAEKMSKAD